MQEEWQAEVFPSGLDSMHVTSMSYQLELDSVCLSLSSGSLVLVHAETHAVEEVGSIEGGISAMEWSPDGDVLAMVTGAGNLLVMSQEWEVLSEVALQASLADRQEGSGGSGDIDDAYADARVSWRGDGKFFATGFRTASGSRLVSTPPRVSVGPTHPHMSGNMLGSAHPPCVFSFFMRFHRRMVCLPVRHHHHHPFCCSLTDVCARLCFLCMWQVHQDLGSLYARGALCGGARQGGPVVPPVLAAQWPPPVCGAGQRRQGSGCPGGRARPRADV